MIQDPIKFFEGSAKVPIRLTIREGPGRLDLTGATVKLIINKEAEGTAVSGSPFDAVVTDAANGVVTYTTTGTESFNVANIYKGQLKVTFPSGKIIFTEIFRIIVQKHLV